MVRKMNVEEFVANLTDEQRHETIRTYEQFEKEGFIGESEIRIQAERLMDAFNDSDGHTTIWMRAIGNACYKYYYHQTFSKW